MKKVLTALVLVSLLAILAVPLVASAQEPLPAGITTCKMRHVLTGAEWTTRGIACPTAVGTVCSLVATPTPSTCGEAGTATCTCGVCCVMDTIYTVTDWIFVAVVVIVIIFILWGAYNLLTSQADPAKIKLGRDQIMYAAIGMLVALLAKAIPLIVRSILGA